MKDWFSVDGTVLMWINSYLTACKQKIKLGDSFCEASLLSFGVQQGFVLGPIFLSVSLDRARASRDHFFFVSGLSSIVVQRDEYLSAHSN